ncbi:hypothetical protein D2Q93_13085 [Alicyclobacillaceae bacterium I2511]|nr:hypothetical protein D2Q93_13085 [Alicyclobacillaceae bacterium I2511]
MTVQPFMLAIPLLTAVMVWFLQGRVRRWLPVVATGINLCLFILGGFVGISGAGPWLAMDRLSAVITGITVFVGFTAALYSVGYVRQTSLETQDPQPSHQVRTYFTLLLIFYDSLLAVVLLKSVFLTWGAIELTALASVLLVDWKGTKTTHEAAWKYLIIMEFGGLLALLGLLLLVGLQPHATVATTWSGLLRAAKDIPAAVQRLAFVLILAGFGTKAGLVPFHAWLPDAHSQAPSPISAMLSGIKLNCGMYGILRTQQILQNGGNGPFADHTLATLGFLTVGISTLMTLYQKDFKRLFAYSSSENLGVVAIAFSLGPVGILAGTLQMINHSLIKSMLFYHSGELQHAWGSTKMEGLSGVARALPFTGQTLVLGMLAIAGAPPFGLFISEFMVVFALVKSGSALLAALLLVFLALLFANFLRYSIAIGYGEISTRFHRTIAPTPAATAALPTALHLAGTLALGMLLPILWSVVRLLPK